MAREFHLFAGIGGGIYGGKLLGHTCCAGVEIDEFCQSVLRQRQADGWMNEFPIYGDLTKLGGEQFRGTFDVLCGGFPCQAFSHAAHGNNIAEKNLWGEMYRFVQESDAPIVFGENVTYKALATAKEDLEKVGYRVEMCKLSCGELGADHRRDRFWLLAVKDEDRFQEIVQDMSRLPKLNAQCWADAPEARGTEGSVTNRREQLKAIGNAQSPLVVATIFRILVNRLNQRGKYEAVAIKEEIESVFEKRQTWISRTYGEDFGLVHTPTTMANYSAPSMMKHLGCRNFKQVFERPSPQNAEYLMGFPIGASSLAPQENNNLDIWNNF
jgi:site-specific DNA-cytosine methylase